MRVTIPFLYTNFDSSNFKLCTGHRYSTIAYVPQTPWLLNASIRDNILFGESYRPRRFQKVLELCALNPDIELMPGGDMAEIGERGINLSGGQRQRIAIGRALYSSANVVIMVNATDDMSLRFFFFFMKRLFNLHLLVTNSYFFLSYKFT